MHADELTLRQQRLIARSTHLREAFAMDVRQIKTPVVLIDQLVSGLDWLRKHPAWPVGGLVLATLIRPRKAVSWAGGLWWAWGAVKQVRRWAASQSPPKAAS